MDKVSEVNLCLYGVALCSQAFKRYRIAGNFRGIQFLRFSRLTGKPQKLNP